VQSQSDLVQAVIPDLKDKVVLITGASTGIGAAAAHAFGRNGAKVAINYNASGSEAEKVASAIEAGGGQSLLVQGDVTKPEAAAAIVAQTVQKFGRLDVLVNNAGALVRRTPVAEYSDELLDAVLDINVKQVVRFIREGALQMRKQGGKGCIINLSSIAGRLAFAMRSPYAASKWAVIGFSKSLAAELGPFDITVNAILPGHVRTERFDRVVAAKARAVNVPEEEMRRAYLNVVSLKRNVEMDDIANMALYLASPFGRNITGQALSVCGDVQMMR
jgi:3-oxoacyl-[acyl-carrier protein] reductase